MCLCAKFRLYIISQKEVSCSEDCSLIIRNQVLLAFIMRYFTSETKLYRVWTLRLYSWLHCTLAVQTEYGAHDHFAVELLSLIITDPNFQNCHSRQRKSSSRSPSPWSLSFPSSTSSRMSSTPLGQTPSSCRR